MKHKIVIATVAAAAVIGTGAVSAVATPDEDVPQTQHRSSVQLTAAAGDDARDGRDGRDDDADDRDGRDDADDRDGRDDDRGGDDRNKDGARAAQAAKTDAEKAVAAALEARPGTVTEAELDEDDGAPVWEINVLGKDGTWHDLDIDPDSGTVRHQHTDDGPDSDDHGQKYVREDLKDARTDAAEASRKAASHGTVTSVDLADDHGRLGTVWKVEVVPEDGSERHLAVDVTNGKVTKLTADDDRDDDRDDGTHDDSDD